MIMPTVNPFYQLTACLSIWLLFIAGCNTPATTDGEKVAGDRLGAVDIHFEGEPAALEIFRKGLLLLHSFEYSDARDAFVEARTMDSTLVMAYWGEAMTYNHPLWRQQDLDKARAALDALAPTPEARLEMAKTTLEKDFIRSADILFGVGEKSERDQRFRDHLAGMHERYPDDNEVAAFYALSILGAVPVGRDDEMYEKGARVAMSILSENPLHPGALHYAIHSYDDPGHAYLAREVADRYSEVAPDATHALHMPSHIYVALGRWHDVVRSNVASWNSSVNRMRTKELGQDAVSYHALHWLLYGYLQQDNLMMADSIMRCMQRYVEISPSINARGYMAEMMANYVTDTRNWTSTFADNEVDLDSLNIVDQTEYLFVKGMRSFASDDKAALEKHLDDLRQRIEKAELFVSEEGLSMCGSGSQYSLPNRLDVDQSRVMQLLLRSFLEQLDGNPDKTEALIKEAIQLESGLSYSYGPPSIPLSGNERYAEWLLQNKRYEEALKYFILALEKGPERISCLRGALAAARETGNSDAIADLESRIAEIQAQSAAKDPGVAVLY